MEKNKIKLEASDPAKKFHGISIITIIFLSFLLFTISSILFSNFLTIATYEEIINKNNLDIAGEESNLDQDLRLGQKNIKIQITLLLVLGVIIISFISIVISRILTFPIKKLIRGTKEIASGNLDYRLDVQSPPEIAELSYSFNQMGEDIKTSLANLKTEQEKTRSIIAYLTDGIIVINEHKEVILLNPKAKDLLGFGKNDKWQMMVKENLFKSPKACNRNLAKAVFINEKKPIKNLFSSKTSEYAITVEESGGEEKILKITTTPLYNSDSKIYSVMHVLHDVSREKAIDKIKSEFITIAAHQLRTPLSAIKWALQLVIEEDDKNLNPTQKELIDKAEKSNDRMIRLVNDLLDVSSIEEGRFGYNFKQQDIGDLIKEIESIFKEKAAAKNIKFSVNMPENLQKIKMDKERLFMSIENLVDNAFKYTPEYGSIKLTVEEKDGKAIIQVSDNGVGIPENQQERMFSKFYRGSNVMRMQTEGSGLGLFIVKNIINKHKGEISFESREGKGTKMTIKLPIA